jgi:hypothetical protein
MTCEPYTFTIIGFLMQVLSITVLGGLIAVFGLLGLRAIWEVLTK